MKFRDIALTTALLYGCASPETVTLDLEEPHETMERIQLFSEADNAADKATTYLRSVINDPANDKAFLRVLLDTCVVLRPEPTANSTSVEVLINPIMITSNDKVVTELMDFPTHLFLNMPVGIRYSDASQSTEIVRGPYVTGRIVDSRVEVDPDSPGSGISYYAIGNTIPDQQVNRGPFGTLEPPEVDLDILDIGGNRKFRLHTDHGVPVGVAVSVKTEKDTSDFELCTVGLGQI